MDDRLIRIRSVFEDSQLSQTAIAKKIEKTPQYIWKILNDDTAKPSVDVVKAISEAFKVNYLWLKDGIGSPDIEPDDEFSEITTIIGKKDLKAKQAIIDYWNLSDEDKELFWKFIERFTGKERD